MANTARAQLTSTLLTRFDIPPGFRERQMREPFPTGNPAVDRLLRGGLPRAAFSEICGGPSSSRTAVLMAALVRALKAGECCVWIDSSGTFDPWSAAAAGLPLERLLWINCQGQAEHALKATDLLIHGGGFGLVVLDLADIAETTLRRIAMTSWFRLRRAAEETGSALIVLTSIPQTRSCSTVHLELKRQKSLWRGKLLRGVSSHLETRKRSQPESADFDAVL